MKRLWLCFCFTTALFYSTAHASELWIFSYHDVVATDAEAEKDPYAVSTARLSNHFSWLRANGYTVISQGQLLDARRDGKALPDRSVMLVFDDGYKSHYELLLPLLKAYAYPAVFAVVGRWMEQPPALKRSRFMTWHELRTAVDSGWVEVASHSYDSHHGVASNPQGDEIPALVARRYHSNSHRYENQQERFQRLYKDLRTSRQLLARKLGKAPRSVVWPYGRYNHLTVTAARQAGFQALFHLAGGCNDDSTPLDHLTRIMIYGNPDAATFAKEFIPRPPAPLRAMHVELDKLFDQDPANLEQNLSRLLHRVKEAGINTVFLQAFASPEGNNKIQSLYFPNRHLPVRADLFSWVAWRLHRIAGVSVYAWLPLLNYALPREAAPEPSQYEEESELFPKTLRRFVSELWEDLASSAIFQGVIFHDDAYMAINQTALSSPDPNTLYTEFTMELSNLMRNWQPELKTVRNIYSQVLLDTLEKRALEDRLSHYDYLAIMAFPLVESLKEPNAWVDPIADRIFAAGEKAVSRTIFELQTVDWFTKAPLDSALLASQFRNLRLRGAKNLAYYPEDSLKQHPQLSVIKPWLSVFRTIRTSNPPSLCPKAGAGRHGRPQPAGDRFGTPGIF